MMNSILSTPQVSFCLLLAFTGLLCNCSSPSAQEHSSHNGDTLQLQPSPLLPQAESEQAQALAAFSVAINRELIGDTEGALDAYEEAIRQDPENDALYMVASRQLLQAGRSEDALLLIQTLLEKHPENTTARRWLAKWYLLNGDQEKAQAELSIALSYAPTSEILYLEAIQLALREKDLNEVIRISRLATQQADDPLRSSEILVNLLLAEKENAPDLKTMLDLQDEIDSVLTQAIEKFPEETRFPLLQASIAIDNNQWPLALEIYSQLDQQWDSSEEIRNTIIKHGITQSGGGMKGIQNFNATLQAQSETELSLYFMGVISELLRDPKAAMTFYQQAYALAPENFATLRKLALTTYQNDQNVEAMALLEKALALHPNDPEVLLLAGQMSLSVKKFDQAQRYLEKRLLRARQGESLDNPSEVHAQLAMSHLALDQKQKAADAMVEAATTPGNLEWVWQFHLQQLYQLQETNPEAAEQQRKELILLLEDLSDRLPENPEIELLIGRSHAYQKDYAAALDAFVRYETIAQTSEEKEFWLNEAFYFDYAAACERNGQIEKATTLFEKIIADAPQHHPSLNYLAYMWAEQNQNLEQALAYSKRSNKLDPNNGSYLDTLGWIYFQQGNYKKAYNILLKAAELTPEESVIAEHLGDVTLKWGRPWEARAYYRIALELDAAERTEIVTASLREAENALTRSFAPDSMEPPSE
ncbi:tetratricopeptide repeat protein [Kiritimatiellota bacterium B12222]|nr:tetratricopeptide repeat protein [Kiritimatiellota bacterium B12222]